MRLNQRILASVLTTLTLGSLSLAMLGSSPTPASELKGTSPEKKPAIPAGLTYLQDQLYCMPDKDTKLMADVLLPKAGNGPYPAVVCLHGGGWVKGSRKTNLPIMIKLAEAGYVAVSVQYRLAHEAPFPAAVHDVKCAVRWLRANAGVFKINSDRIAAFGYSSGGQLAGLLGLTTPLNGLEGEGGFPIFSSRVQVVVSYYGISDLAEWHKDGGLLARFCLNKFMKDSPDKAAKLYEQGSLVSYARSDLAAVLLVHGTEDTLVPFKQSRSLEKKLKAAGAKVRLLPIEGAGHNFDGEAEKEADAAAIKYLDEMLRFKETVRDANGCGS
jgi:acetyl esterase/lipase